MSKKYILKFYINKGDGGAIFTSDIFTIVENSLNRPQTSTLYKDINDAISGARYFIKKEVYVYDSAGQEIYKGEAISIDIIEFIENIIITVHKPE